MKSDDSTEAVVSSSATIETADMSKYSKYGRLQDPKGTKHEYQDETNEDSSSILSNPSAFDVKHQQDPRYINIEKEEKRHKKNLLNIGKLTVQGKSVNPVIPDGVNEGLRKLYQDVSDRYGANCILEVADTSYRVRKANARMGEAVVEFQDMANGRINQKEMLETAEDDRVVGIPYTIANIGADKYYVINGRVYSGWAMWFGMQAIRSPEQYDRNVDIAYNVPFVWSGFQLKSQLSLGASFDIVHGSEDEETPEETFIKEIFFSKLKIGKNKLAKTSMHLDIYGNSYWHIRRDGQGFPDKITILQPERIKVFLDPKTTKVLYYIYLPPILAGMALTPYPNIRENPNILHGPALTYPTPIIMDPADIIHFKENDFTEYPFGLSSCKAMIDPCSARMDINVLAPMIFKKYAKPMIHWRLDPVTPFQLTKGQIEGYIDGMKSTLEHMEPMSDPITSTRWTAQPIGAAQGKAELLTILQDLDNQIFACIGVPETYFKPQMGNDRMIAEQDKTLIAAMEGRQQLVSEKIQEQLVKPIIDKYDEYINLQLPADQQIPDRMWNQYPTVQWRETFKQDQITTIQNTMSLLQAGLIDHARAARRVGERPPQESTELSRQQDIQRMTEEVQIKSAELQYLQTELQIMDTQQVIGLGGTMAVQAMQAEAAAQAEGGSGGGGQKASKEGEKKSEPAGGQGAKSARENQMLRVTFINRAGKKQTQDMRASTLDSLKSGGTAIQKVSPAGTADQAQTPNQRKAGDTLK